MSDSGNVYNTGEITTTCARCGCSQLVPTRSKCYSGEEGPGSQRFFDWSRQDEFWDEEYADAYNVFAAGVVLSVTTDGFVEPLAPVYAQDGRRTFSIVPDFGESVHWVCGPCKMLLPDQIVRELPPVDIFV